MSTALCFNDVAFDVVDRNGHPWLKSSQLAAALGYGREDKIAQIYQRNADEFGENMTQLIEIVAEPHFGTGLSNGRMRIFSLRGCHAIAMFSRTKIAKAFRVWVLDVLDNHVGREQPALDATTSARLSQRGDLDRKALTNLKNTWVSLAPFGYRDASQQVNAHFRVAGVDDMTQDQVKDAIKWVQGKIDALTIAHHRDASAKQIKALEAAHKIEERKKAAVLTTKYDGIQKRLQEIRSELFLASLEDRGGGQWQTVSGIIGGLDFMSVQLNSMK